MRHAIPVTTPTWAPADAPEVLSIDGQPTGISLWTAQTRQQRNTGLLGTDDLAGSLWITRCNWVHTIGMRYSIDVVYLSRRGRVVAVRTMPPGRIGLPRLRATAVLELPAGLAQRQGITRGVALAAARP